MSNLKQQIIALKNQIAQLKQDCRNYLHEVEALKSACASAYQGIGGNNLSAEVAELRGQVLGEIEQVTEHSAEETQAEPNEIQIPAGWVRNATGNLIHETEISEQDKLRDQVVMGIAIGALRLNAEMKALKRKALAEISDLITIAGEKYDMKIGGPKGNVSLLSFDGRFKLKRIHQDSIGYTEEMEVAKAKVFECISRWGQTVHEDAHKHLLTLATRAFRPTRGGEISISRVTDMLRAEINDPDWKKAKQAVMDSLIVNGKAVYIQVQQRVGDKKYQTILLDIAGV